MLMVVWFVRSKPGPRTKDKPVRGEGSVQFWARGFCLFLWNVVFIPQEKKEPSQQISPHSSKLP